MSLRSLFFHAFLLTALLMGTMMLSPASADQIMLIQATLNPAQTQQGVHVTIAGRVFDTSGGAISNAIVSIQVTNPQGTSIHLAVAYSSSDGSFQDNFIIPLNSPGGNYTAYLVADKPGYVTARVTLSFSYSTPDFTLQSSTNELTLHQGDVGRFNLTLLTLRGFNEPVNFTALNVPPGVSLQFTPSSTTLSRGIAATVTISETAAIGNFTITIIAVSPTATHTASLQLLITPGPIEVVYYALPALTVALIVSLIILRRRRKRMLRRAAVEDLLRTSLADEGYVATARLIARLEELRAASKVDEATYQKLKREYEKRLERSK